MLMFYNGLCSLCVAPTFLFEGIQDFLTWLDLHEQWVHLKIKSRRLGKPEVIVDLHEQWVHLKS